MLCRTAVLEVSSARGVFIEKVKANTLMILREQLEWGKKGFISDLQNANYGLVTATSCLGYIKVTSKPLRLLPVWVGADLGVRVFECGWALHAWGKGAAHW